jgi:hypothetical protein
VTLCVLCVTHVLRVTYVLESTILSACLICDSSYTRLSLSIGKAASPPHSEVPQATIVSSSVLNQVLHTQ